MIEDPLLLSKKRPELSAAVPLVLSQKLILLGLLFSLAGLTAWYRLEIAKLFILISTVFYLAYSVYKLVLVRYSVLGDAEIEVTEQDIAALDENSLPIYSVLVPMYHEPETVRHLVKALEAMDYPADKKDIQLLLEEDDTDTLEAVAALSLPEGFRVTVIPDSHPKTKPKACNIGLARAKGEYLVIYDAEDRPEKDQLKKAVTAFSRVEESVVCLQSKLNFFNPRQNLLTRWFAAEYSAWFDLSLAGLSSLNGVMPLGGTSNHFITSKLDELMGWDAYNVTEDCDLGIRIYRAGYKSRMLNTTTWEEACSRLEFWVCQRTRWVKGYIQTYMVHMRRPVRLIRELGLINFLHFQLLIGGSVFTSLINPLFWALAVVWFGFRLDLFMSLFPGPVFAMGALCLFVGNFTFVYIGAVACYKRGYYDILKYALLVPFHWVLISYSGWRAFIQFFTNPFHWEKTQHGLFPEKTEEEEDERTKE